FDPLKRRMFMLPLRWHANPINSRWRPVKRKSKRILRFCLGKGFVAVKPVMACFRLVTGHLDSWEEYQDRGIQRDAAGGHFGAAEDLAQAIRVGPANPALHCLRGMALLRAGDLQDAATEFEAGQKLDPNNIMFRGLLDSYRSGYWFDEGRWQPAKPGSKWILR